MKYLLSISLVLNLSLLMGQSKKELRQSISDLNMQKTVLESQINKKDSLISNISLKLKTTEEQLAKAELDAHNLGESFSEATLENMNLTSELKELNKTIEKLKSGNTSKLVHLDYNNPINGFNVSIIWRPEIKFGEHLQGPGIISFEHPDKEKNISIAHQYISILEKDVPFIKVNESSGVVQLLENKATLSYDKSSTSKSNPFLIDEVPFFFKNIDFSNVNDEELVLLEVGKGTRLRNSFKVFDGLEYQHPKELKHSPFNELQDSSKINYSKRTISNYIDIGYCANHYEVYGFEKVSEYSEFLQLRFIIKEERGNYGKCYWNTYKVGDRKLTFVRKSVSN